MIAAGAQAITSYLDWWSAAGLTDAVDDAPCAWLAPPVERGMPLATVAIQRSVAAPVAPQSAEAPLPADLAAFDAWLADAADLPGADWSARRILPAGPAAAPLMLLADVPEPADIEAGQLFSGKQGQLVDAMLAAIGLSRAQCRIGSVALTRPVGGRIDGAAAPRLSALARHHVALAAPRALLLLGQQSAQLVAQSAIPATPDKQDLNHNGVTTAAFAIHHPRLLLERPLLKRPAWETLKHIRESLRP